MSLSSHLKDRGSPVRRFLREEFPNSRAVQLGCRERIASATTIRPPAQIRYATVGTALDYRLRYYFAVTPVEELAAFQGAIRLPRHLGGPYVPVSTNESEDYPEANFFKTLNLQLEQIQPVGKKLSQEFEEDLARYCFVLALYEELFRAPLGVNSPLFQSRLSVTEMLAIASDHEVEDLCALSRAFYDEFHGLLSHNVVLNPTFDGSRDVGGADADMIIDGCLLELKTTVDARIEMQYLHQLLGYILLDYTNYYAIESLGILFTRQCILVQWPLDQLIRDMRDGDVRSISDLRVRFKAVASKSRKTHD